MSKAPSICPKCGAAMDWRSQCPACALEGMLSGTAGEEEIARVGKYRLIAELGRGGMGRVWRAREEGLGREVALKTLNATWHAEPAAWSRIRREAEILARLRHPGVVSIYEAGEADGEVYLAMEYVPGTNLEERLKTGPLENRQAAEWVLALADAVEHAHSKGVLHLDLKPSNVLLDAERHESPRLTDFGIARWIGEGAAVPAAVTDLAGSLPYLAPERLANPRAGATAAADIYGLGAILYRCVTGHAPIEGDAPEILTQRVIEGCILPPSRRGVSIPAALEKIVMKCLAREPQARYATAGELRDALARFLKTRFGAFWPPRRMWLAAAAIALFAVLGNEWRKEHRESQAQERTMLALTTNWPPGKPEIRREVHLRAGIVCRVKFSPSGRWLALGDTSGFVLVTTADGREKIGEFAIPSQIRDFSWSADDRWLAIGGIEGQFAIWAPIASPPPAWSGTNSSRVDVLAFSPSGEFLYVSGLDGRGHLHHWDGRALRPAAEMHHSGAPWGAEFAPDGRRLLVSTDVGQTTLWHGETGVLVKELSRTGSPQAGFSPDGRAAALIWRDEDGTWALRVFDTATGEPSPIRRSVGSSGNVFYSPDGGRIALHFRREVHLLAADTLEPICPPLPQAPDSLYFEFTRDGLTCATSGHDLKVQVWDAVTGQMLVEPFPNPYVQWLTRLSPDGTTLVTCNEANFGRLWDIRPRWPKVVRDQDEAVALFRRAGTLPALRLAAGLAPQDREIRQELAERLWREGAGWTVRLAEHLANQAQ